LKKITKYIVTFIVVVVGISLILFGNSYKKKYHASRMEIRSAINLGEYVLAEQRLAELKNTFLYKQVFKRFKLQEYYQIFYDGGLIQLGLGEYAEAKKMFSVAFESGDPEISSPAGLNQIASLWFSGQRNPKIIKTILDSASKIIRDNHDVSASYEKRQAQQIAYYIMARQQDMVPKKEGKAPASVKEGEKKEAQIEDFKNLMQKKAQEEGR